MNSQRMDIQQIDPAAYQRMFAMEQYIHGKHWAKISWR